VAIRQKRQDFDLATAQQECEKLMNTSVAQKCSEVANFDIAPYLNNCVADAMVSLLSCYYAYMIIYPSFLYISFVSYHTIGFGKIPAFS